MEALTLNYVCTLYETEYLASRNLAPPSGVAVAPHGDRLDVLDRPSG
jgi:hypothetical protein